MARVTQITSLDLAMVGADDAQASIASVSVALRSFESVPQVLREQVDGACSDLIVDAADGGVDLVAAEVVDGSADRADKVVFGFKPGQRYLELVSAIAAHGGDCLSVEFRHGWPILSAAVHSDAILESTTPAAASVAGVS